MTIVFTGGGTAGHIFPIVALAREIKKIYIDPDLRLFYIGPNDEFVEEVFVKEGIKTKIILAGKLRRYFTLKTFFQNIFDIFVKIPLGFLQALFWLFIINPDLVFSKGGYGALPVSLSAWLLLTPIILHESDVKSGLANKILSHFASEIFVSFPVDKTSYFPSNKMIHVGNPIRTEILAGDKEEAKRIFKLKGSKQVVLVLGGSQGSQRINDIILALLPEILFYFEVIHQTGTNNFEQVKKEASVALYSYQDKNIAEYYHIVPFLTEEELKHAYKVSDLIVSRAGSGSIFEIAAVGKPAILIPLPESAQNHQLQNAYTYAEYGGCLVVEEINLTPHFLLEEIKITLSQPEKIKKMGIAARVFSKETAAKVMAEYIIEYLKQ